MQYTEHTYRKALATFLRQEVYPFVEEWEHTHFFPKDVVSRMGQQDFFAPCLLLAENNMSGAQSLPLNIHMFQILIEELAKTCCFGLTLSICMHVGVFLPLICRLAQPEIRATVLSQALQGTAIGTLAISEQETAGSDVLSMECTAQFNEHAIVLNGYKYYITNAAIADYVIVFARWKPGRQFTNFCAILVPTRQRGVQSTRIEMAVMQTAIISDLRLHNVELSPTFLLGRKALGVSYFLQHIAVERLAGGIWAVAVAQHCLIDAQRHAMAHVIGDQTLWERSSVRHQIAQALIQVTLMKALVTQSIDFFVTHRSVDPFASAVLKASLAPVMEQVIGVCLQLQGARGLQAHSLLLRLLNEFRVFGVAGGSTETMLDIVAEQLAQQSQALEIDAHV